MTPEDVTQAADRAANAAGRCSVKRGGWVAEIGGVGGAEFAASLVRRWVDAPAEALFLRLRTHDVAWCDLEPRKRAAVEVFRATVLVLDKLVPASGPSTRARQTRGYLAEGETELRPGAIETRDIY